jgi:pimeloyl-ACP methyl ester carboxylesterase
MTTTSTIGSVFTERFVDAAGFRVRYLEAGSGEPVLYLPGAGGPVMSKALDSLADTYRMLVLELPGLGDQPNDITDLDQLADQVDAIATALGLDTFRLMGTSFGGATALHYVTKYAARVQLLVLEAPAKQRLDSQHPATMTPQQLVAGFRTHPDRDPVFNIAPPDGSHRWGMINRVLGDGALDEAFKARLAQCITPTLVLWGTDDGITNPVNGRVYRQLMRSCTLQYVYDAAHDIQNDRPEAFADVVGDFFARSMVFMVNKDDGLINP